MSSRSDSGRPCVGVVLAGGASTRFGGRPKGLVEVGGRRLIDRVLAALRAATPRQLVVANDAALLVESLDGVPVHGDVRLDRGSLVGLHSALTIARGNVLAVAWDMPFVSAPLLAALRELGERHGTAAIPEGPRGLEPLCAYYPYTCRALVDAQLDRQELRLSAFVDALPARTILQRDDVAEFGELEYLFANVNTPADLVAAQRWEERRARQGQANTARRLTSSSEER